MLAITELRVSIAIAFRARVIAERKGELRGADSSHGLGLTAWFTSPLNMDSMADDNDEFDMALSPGGGW